MPLGDSVPDDITMAAVEAASGTMGARPPPSRVIAYGKFCVVNLMRYAKFARLDRMENLESLEFGCNLAFL